MNNCSKKFKTKLTIKKNSFIISLEPLTEEKFLACYKVLCSKLNHLTNLTNNGKALEMVNEEERSLLPSFPLKSIPDFEEFEENLLKSSEIQKLYVSRLFINYTFL